MTLSRARHFARVFAKTAVLGLFYTTFTRCGTFVFYGKNYDADCRGARSINRLGALKLPIERNLAVLHRQEHFHGVEFNLDLRKARPTRFVAALSGFRSIVADALSFKRIRHGKTLNGSNAIIVPASHNAATTVYTVWTQRPAYGLERERGRHE